MKNSFTVRIDTTPRTKQRPRLGRRRKAYTPEATLVAEAIVREAYVAADGPCFEGPVVLDLQFDKLGITVQITDADHNSKLRGDLDNYVKLVGDALNGIAYKDDKQVVVIVASKH